MRKYYVRPIITMLLSPRLNDNETVPTISVCRHSDTVTPSHEVTEPIKNSNTPAHVPVYFIFSSCTKDEESRHVKSIMI